jgi:glycosyltransferase involved in cell wall biosynthesis
MRVLQVDIVVPVRNEERDLAPSIRRVVGYLRESFPFTARVTIADNGSTDATWAIADRLARELPEVRAVHLELPGRGRALRAIWSQGEAEVLAYMDVDLSTDLNALLPLVAPLLSGHSDLAIGTRLARGSRVIRGPKRELISRGYNLLLRTLMGARFSDAQCGFKAIRRDQARVLLPLTRDTGWFFDTELLVLAERAGLRIHEIPVDWIDDLDSRVDIVATALADLRGMARLGAGLARGSIRVPRLRGPVLAGGRPARDLAALSPAPGRLAEVCGLLAANLVATVIRFLLYRHWVFRRPERPPDPWSVTGTVQRNDLATQGERTT